MILNLLSSHNYISFNINLAHMLGLHSAIYLSELLSINEKAVEKNKIADGFFSVDRKYIEKRTTLDKQEQLKIDTVLSEIGILETDKEKNNVLKIQIANLINLLSENNESLVDNIKDFCNKKTKVKITKEQEQSNLMKSFINTDNSELYKAYCDWIDAVYSKLHWMSKKAVVSAQQKIDEVSNHDLDIALAILDIATINGYKDIIWAIKRYKETNSIPAYRIKSNTQDTIQKNVEISDEVF